MESFDALLAAAARAICPVPQPLIATESDASQWSSTIAGKQYRESDVARLRPWIALLGSHLWLRMGTPAGAPIVDWSSKTVP